MGKVKSGGICYDAYQLPFQNMYEILAATSQKFPNKVGLIDTSGKITFWQMRVRVDALSVYLYHHMNVRVGSSVALMENGYLYIKDRIKDMINRGGEKVFSLPVEDTIMEFGGIRQAAVFAVNDSLYGEVPGAVIIAEEGETIDLQALKLFLREKLAHYKVPVYMEIRAEVPTTANGKPRKYQLRAEFNQKYAK